MTAFYWKLQNIGSEWKHSIARSWPHQECAAYGRLKGESSSRREARVRPPGAAPSHGATRLDIGAPCAPSITQPCTRVHLSAGRTLTQFQLGLEPRLQDSKSCVLSAHPLVETNYTTGTRLGPTVRLQIPHPPTQPIPVHPRQPPCTPALTSAPTPSPVHRTGSALCMTERLPAGQRPQPRPYFLTFVHGSPRQPDTRHAEVWMALPPAVSTYPAQTVSDWFHLHRGPLFLYRDPGFCMTDSCHRALCEFKHPVLRRCSHPTMSGPGCQCQPQSSTECRYRSRSVTNQDPSEYRSADQRTHGCPTSMATLPNASSRARLFLSRNLPKTVYTAARPPSDRILVTYGR